jgi:MFS family permease
MMTRMLTPWKRFAALLRLPDSFRRRGQRESGTSRAPEVEDLTTAYLADLLAETREELTRADSKAGLLLAASGVVIGALLAGLFGSKWTPFVLNHTIEWLWWLGVISAAFGVFSIAAAVYPRIRQHKIIRPGLPTYYGDVVSFGNLDEFRRALEDAPSPRERLINQVFVLSNIVHGKYVLLRRGLRFLLLAILTCTAAVIINVPLTRLDRAGVQITLICESRSARAGEGTCARSAAMCALSGGQASHLT